MQRSIQLLTRSEVVALKHVLNPAVEPLDPLPGSALEMHERDAVGLR